ncbi:hypothetical protein HMPREF9630_02051 [Peptoanaerobacter stomatis]|uniref:Long-chain-fatty-acyl-CoA reductase n=1 Tax=Peptoanaerobacter stomatis TaxID=796937 RepID=V9HJZ2_9FIRM|nr:acyl-CoA reductase [Peptoanaerobacter stomatis]EHL15653.1 hypothetical protein HMPREF9630_02051 [Peptoanaerobacter stomatis]
MLKLEDVVIPMRENNVYHYIKSDIYKGKILDIFDSLICEFLNDLSIHLMNTTDKKLYPDIITFAFYIRKSNILKKKELYANSMTRIGKGVVFHIAPSNVPINFAFSLVFGLLSGNINIVRVSKKDFKQTKIICNSINNILDNDKYSSIKNNISIISYEHNKKITDYYSNLCDVRIIWGGDNTINEIRTSPINTRTMELTFADRYSFSIISAKSILDSSDEQLKRLSENFYNDTYLIDQNACSSPHLIVWKNDVENYELLKKSKDIFWKFVYNTVKKWEIEDVYASEKYTLACEYATIYEEIDKLERYDNYIYILNLNSIKNSTIKIKGKLGLFSQISIDSYDEIAPLLKKETQTITYYGIVSGEIVDFIKKIGTKGVDRIVPFGKSLELDLIWDGYDIINMLSRIIYR